MLFEIAFFSMSAEGEVSILCLIISHFLDIPVNKSYILVMADVSSLLTIIKYTDAVESVKWVLDSSDLSRRHQKFLLKCLQFGLQYNYFWYDKRYKRYFLQTTGVAMGACFAPSVACFCLTGNRSWYLITDL